MHVHISGRASPLNLEMRGGDDDPDTRRSTFADLVHGKHESCCGLPRARGRLNQKGILSA